MWNSIVLVPDHCLFIYFKNFTKLNFHKGVYIGYKSELIETNWKDKLQDLTLIES